MPEKAIPQQGNNLSGSSTEKPAPLYEKPVLRKYDQIDQVKPYGPSEKEAG